MVATVGDAKNPPYDLSQHKQTSNHIIATIANKDGIA